MIAVWIALLIALVIVVYIYVTSDTNVIYWSEVQEGTNIHYDWGTYYIEQNDKRIDIEIPSSENSEELHNALTFLNTKCNVTRHHNN